MIEHDDDYAEDTKPAAPVKPGRAYVNPFLKAVQRRLAADRAIEAEQRETFAREIPRGGRSGRPLRGTPT